MNRNAKAWVRALRSGKYQQGTGLLTDKDKNCCLGVACQLAVKAGVCRATPYSGGTVRYGRQLAYLPVSVRRWLGLRSREGIYYSPTATLCSLTNANDGGMPFSEIADLIESEPQGLFVRAYRKSK